MTCDPVSEFGLVLPPLVVVADPKQTFVHNAQALLAARGTHEVSGQFDVV